MSAPTTAVHPGAAPPPPDAPAAVPDWPSGPELEAAVATLRDRPPLVRYADCLALRRRLAEVAAGRAVAIQGGDCAELVAEVSAAHTARKVAQLTELAGLLRAGTGLPAVRIGRIAGQFAKPRSAAVETTADGRVIPVYRGDAVNDLAPSAAARTPDPRRLLLAYAASARVLAHLPAEVYASHEALLPEYEQPLIRSVTRNGPRFASSAHLLWVGHRTRGPGGTHIDMVAGIANPVGVKLGPGITPDDLRLIVERLDPHRVPGRLVLIARFGAGRVADDLPRLVAAVRGAGASPVWICDPMHGNTVLTADGRKTRSVADVVAEVRGFVCVLRGHGAHPGGLHLELSPDDVTECVATRAEATGRPHLPRYRTACDPRLDPCQARQVVRAFVEASAAAPHRTPEA